MDRNRNLPIVVFFLILGVLFFTNAFSSLYGDEYDSLFDSLHLTGNIHALGYFSQLWVWSSISAVDWFLRVLSLIWFGAGLYWLDLWLQEEGIDGRTRMFIVWLAILNPFLWMYGFQIRFYVMFFSASILWVWRVRALQKARTKKNWIFFLLSAVLLFTSHLFGFLAAGIILASIVWENAKNKKLLAIGILLGFILLLLPPVRAELISLVYRTSNPYADVPQDVTARGISVGMVAKIPLTFYFFALGERVYPLWWWVTIPSMLVIGVAFLLGLWKFRKLEKLGTLSIFMLFAVPLMYLILDPLAPPGLQGAAPRYLIFVVPYGLILLAHGAETWKPLKPALIFVNLVGLYCLAFPVWSYGGSDLVNWKKILAEAIPNPAQTCVITDGRAHAPVERYAPQGVTIARQGTLSACEGFTSIVLVSNDYRLSMVRYFDEMSAELGGVYNLISNATMFPAQVTVYEKTAEYRSALPPSRLDLPEQDLQFPIHSPRLDAPIRGFSRLDDELRSITILSNEKDIRALWVATNYRIDSSSIPLGTPVFKIEFHHSDSTTTEFILHAGRETSEWQGICESCVELYQWTKRLHLLGSSSYAWAYRQYQARVWAHSLPNIAFESMTISFLPAEGVGYFYGIFPQEKR